MTAQNHMSTTEDQAAADVYVTGSLALRATHVWTDADGVTHGAARLGSAEIVFHSPQQARDVIAYLATLAGEMDAEIRRQQPARDDSAWGKTLDAIEAFQAEPEPGCPKCGATDVPKHEDGSCFNLSHCADRAEARDAAKAALSSFPVVPAGQIEAEVAADVHRLLDSAR